MTRPIRGSWDDPSRSAKWRKAMQLKGELGLTDEERYELAQFIPGVDKDDGGSWKDLDEHQLHDIICYMEGFLLLTFIYSQRGNL